MGCTEKFEYIINNKNLDVVCKVKNIDNKEIFFNLGGHPGFNLPIYEGEKFEVYHRLYDVINITVVSDKDTVGYYDMNSKVVVK